MRGFITRQYVETIRSWFDRLAAKGGDRLSNLNPVVGMGAGLLFYFLLLVALGQSLKSIGGVSSTSRHLWIGIGIIGVWRYGLGITHFVRGMIFLHYVFPRARREAEALGEEGIPSHVYFLITSFRIPNETTLAVYRSAIMEAIACGSPATIVGSIVELADEELIKTIWKCLNPPSRVTLRLIRLSSGIGKRDGLAQGFRVISRDLPDDRAVVAVIDGDTMLRQGVIRKVAPFFILFPSVGGITTNEFCYVEGYPLLRQWYKLRFAQRHINMCSMAMSHRVLTMTGRMSLFRASVVTHPEFIFDVENDFLDHWRLGRFPFLTGDDKSSWYSLMRQGYDTYYVPDAAIDTIETAVNPSFFTATRKLMFRWYGNSLRQNHRAICLGLRRLGAFGYYVLLDQRVAMWVTLIGPVATFFGTLKYGVVALLTYLLWVATSRVTLTLLLTASGHRIGVLASPWLLYYNQIIGSLMKIYVLFHLDQQSWTRQGTVSDRDVHPIQVWFNRWSSLGMLFSAWSVFLALIFAWT